MVTLIHGGHRHGTHWEVLQLLKTELEATGVDVHVIDLATLEFFACCGDQMCQIGDCLYKSDLLYKTFESSIIPTDVIYIITPTYFNMPPAKLKSFIDRTNALLPVFEKQEKHVVFGTWVSGEADAESIETHCSLLKEYAAIMGWAVHEEICNSTIITDDYAIDCEKIISVANTIKSLS